MKTLRAGSPLARVGALSQFARVNALSTLPSIPEPPMPSVNDADLDRSGAISKQRDSFMSRKLQGPPAAGSRSSAPGVFRGKDVVPMWIADMDFRAPQPVIDAAVECAERGIFGYTNCPPALTASTLERLERVYGCAAPESSWLHWMPGLVPGLSHSIRVARKRHGKGVAVLTPAYPPFLALPGYHGAELQPIPLAVADTATGGLHHTIDWTSLEGVLAQSATNLLLLCNPHNPTGRCWSREELRRMATLCVEHDVLLCSDEVWGELPLHSYSTPFTSALALIDGGGGDGAAAPVTGLRERLIVLTSPSKCFNIATLDIALAIVPDADLRKDLIAEGRDMAEVTPLACESVCL